MKRTVLTLALLLCGANVVLGQQSPGSENTTGQVSERSVTAVTSQIDVRFELTSVTAPWPATMNTAKG